MKIEKSEIAGKLSMLRKAIPSKTDIDCLRGVLISDGTMTATNLNTTIQTDIDCAQDERFILPLKAIEMIENLPDGVVDIQPAKDNTVFIRAGSIKNKVATHLADEFPEIDILESAQQIGIESERLQEAINTVLYAVATVSTRPTVTGLLFDGDGENLNLVALDGYRMAWASIPYKGEFRMIVPKASVQTLLTLGLTGNVNIRFTRRAAVFELSGYTFYSRLLEGEYPEYKRLFPAYKDSVLIDRRSMMESLRRAMICIDDKNRPMVVLDIDGEDLRLSTKSGVGDYSETLRLEGAAGHAVKIGFNARYLQECFKSYSGDVVECFFNGAGDAMVVDDGEVKSLVLPVRLSGAE